MSDTLQSIGTLPNCKGHIAGTNGLLHLPGDGVLLHTPHNTSANALNQIPETDWSVWTLSGGPKDRCMRDPKQLGLLRQTMSDLVSEIAQVIEPCIKPCPLGCVQPLKEVSCYIAGMIVQQFVTGDNVRAIAQSLLHRFPDTLHSRSATNLVENAIKVIQAVRPGWKRLVLMPDEENRPSTDNHAPTSIDSSMKAEVPAKANVPEANISVEPPAENVDIEPSENSSAESTTPQTAVGKPIPDSAAPSPIDPSPKIVDDNRAPVDIRPAAVNAASSKPSAASTQQAEKQSLSESAQTRRAKSAMRLFQHPNLRRFVPAANCST